jgi:hypothetical protein
MPMDGWYDVMIQEWSKATLSYGSCLCLRLVGWTAFATAGCPIQARVGSVVYGQTNNIVSNALHLAHLEVANAAIP